MPDDQWGNWRSDRLIIPNAYYVNDFIVGISDALG